MQHLAGRLVVILILTAALLPLASGTVGDVPGTEYTLKGTLGGQLWNNSITVDAYPLYSHVNDRYLAIAGDDNEPGDNWDIVILNRSSGEVVQTLVWDNGGKDKPSWIVLPNDGGVIVGGSSKADWTSHVVKWDISTGDELWDITVQDQRTAGHSVAVDYGSGKIYHLTQNQSCNGYAVDNLEVTTFSGENTNRGCITGGSETEVHLHWGSGLSWDAEQQHFVTGGFIDVSGVKESAWGVMNTSGHMIWDSTESDGTRSNLRGEIADTTGTAWYTASQDNTTAYRTHEENGTVLETWTNTQGVVYDMADNSGGVIGYYNAEYYSGDTDAFAQRATTGSDIDWRWKWDSGGSNDRMHQTQYHAADSTVYFMGDDGSTGFDVFAYQLAANTTEEQDVTVTNPDGEAVLRPSDVNFTATVTKGGEPVSNADVSFTDFHSTLSSSCSGVKEAAPGTYYCLFDTDGQPYGWHDVKVETDKASDRKNDAYFLGSEPEIYLDDRDSSENWFYAKLDDADFNENTIALRFRNDCRSWETVNTTTDTYDSRNETFGFDQDIGDWSGTIEYKFNTTDAFGWTDESNIDNRTVSDTDCTADTKPPQIQIDVSPADPYDNETVTFTGDADDNTAVSNVTIYVDDTAVKTCTATTCSYDGGPYEAGTEHTAYAAAYDTAGNRGASATTDFTVQSTEDDSPDENGTGEDNQDDTTPPNVNLSIRLDNPVINGTIYIECSAQDSSGIDADSVSVQDPEGRQHGASCNQYFEPTATPGEYVVTYHATDAAGNTETQTEHVIIEQPENETNRHNETAETPTDPPKQPGQDEDDGVTEQELTTAIQKLDRVKSKLEELRGKVHALAQYHQSQGNESRASDWKEVRLKLDTLIVKIENFQAELRTLRQHPEQADPDQLRQNVRDMRQNIDDILDRILET